MTARQKTFAIVVSVMLAGPAALYAQGSGQGPGGGSGAGAPSAIMPDTGPTNPAGGAIKFDDKLPKPGQSGASTGGTAAGQERRSGVGTLQAPAADPDRMPAAPPVRKP